jgi:hypothetical protein
MVADCWPQGAMSSFSRMRVMVLVAVKNDLALNRRRGGSVPRVRARIRVR